jgi:hypothetical protein
MNKHLTSKAFGAPSLETARRIADSDAAHRVHAAAYRAETRLAEIRAAYEDECSRVRNAMLAEIAELEIGGE